MNDKCRSCTCTCNKPWKALKVYDHIKEVDDQLRHMKSCLAEMEHYPDAPWYSRRPFENARSSVNNMIFHIKTIRDKYAKDLGMDDE